MDNTFRNIELIAAVSENGAIGKDGKLPWHYPADLQFFRKMTSNSAIIMGRKTFATIGNRPLPGRTNVVVSSSLQEDGTFMVAKSLEQALEQVRHLSKVFVVGGSALYEEALSVANTVWLTRIPLSIDGATAYFPKLGAEFELEKTLVIAKKPAGFLIMDEQARLEELAASSGIAAKEFLRVDKFVVPARQVITFKAAKFID